MVTPEIIQDMAQRIVEQFQPKEIILFGSCARGEITPDSDVDFLVVMPVAGNRRALRVSIRRALFGFGVPKDVIVLTPDEFERQKEIPGTIAYPAYHEGSAHARGAPRSTKMRHRPP